VKEGDTFLVYEPVASVSPITGRKRVRDFRKAGEIEITYAEDEASMGMVSGYVKGGYPVELKVKRKSPAVAGFLSLIFPGAGHFYNGRLGDVMAGTFYLIVEPGLFLTAVAIGSGKTEEEPGEFLFSTCLALTIALHIIDVIHATHSAHSISKGKGQERLLRSSSLGDSLGSGFTFTVLSERRGFSLLLTKRF
jgi:TM2 domain-containing membrane protein YozV